MGRLKQYVAECAYEDMRGLITEVTKRFIKKHGGDFYEHLAEANYRFAIALDDYDPNRAQFTTFIWHRIYGGLCDYRKRRWRKPELYIEELVEHDWSIRKNYNFLVDFMDMLDKDARIVVRHVMQPDLTLRMILDQKQGLRAARRGLREYLRLKYRWGYNRIDDAFWDITSALWKLSVR